MRGRGWSGEGGGAGEGVEWGGGEGGGSGEGGGVGRGVEEEGANDHLLMQNPMQPHGYEYNIHK